MEVGIILALTILASSSILVKQLGSFDAYAVSNLISELHEPRIYKWNVVSNRKIVVWLIEDWSCSNKKSSNSRYWPQDVNRAAYRPTSYVPFRIKGIELEFRSVRLKDTLNF